MLDRAIEHGKEKRKKFYGAKAVDCSCRNHGSCPWCKGNRLHKIKVAKVAWEDEMYFLDEFMPKNYTEEEEAALRKIICAVAGEK